ncbi:MAG: cytochrome c biogenesis protein CcdA [Desulfosarcinaceae bacterium]|nr:cytochrome c biogenesis protein CcdA [Desulfosarcinaceae bacterium]
MFAQSVTYPAALAFGFLSFFSGCVLPLIPVYFTFITGYSLDQLTDSPTTTIRRKVMFSTLAFVLGFSAIFVLLGASASLMGGLIGGYKDAIRIAGGILILIMGLHLTGLVRIKGLDFEKRIHIQEKPLHLFGTFVVGMAFGAGWSPCIGPTLGSILVIAANSETVWQGIALLSVYSFGLAIPFLVLSIFIHLVLAFIKKAKRFIRYVNLTAGVLLMLMGVLLLTNRLSILSV